MPIKDPTGKVISDSCGVNACLPTIDMGCLGGPPPCCDEPAPKPMCMPVRGRNIIRLNDFEEARYFTMHGVIGCDIDYLWRRVALSIFGTGSCAKEYCCFSAEGVNAQNELLVRWPAEFAKAPPGYYFLRVSVEGYQETVFGLYKPWVGLRVHRSQGQVVAGCDTRKGECMPACAAPVDVLQDRYDTNIECEDCDDTC